MRELVVVARLEVVGEAELRPRRRGAVACALALVAAAVLTVACALALVRAAIPAVVTTGGPALSSPPTAAPPSRSVWRLLARTPRFAT
jgi:hypothetical protein